MINSETWGKAFEAMRKQQATDCKQSSDAARLALFDELVELLSNIKHYMIPGMGWTDSVGQYLINQTNAALEKARAIK